MYFHNKLIWSHKCEYYLLKTWSNVKHLNWHVYYNCILLGTEVVQTCFDHNDSGTASVTGLIH
jgi:hypothetical protein